MSAVSSPTPEVWAGLPADYTDAIIRVASLRADGQHYLLFGWVELYPLDMAAPASWTAGKAPWSVPGRSGWSCAFSATKMTTAQALQWYAEAQLGRLNIAPQRAKSILAHAALLAPEPALGRFSLAGAPFLMPWHDGPRIHRLVPLEKPPRAVYELGRIESAQRWLERHAGFDPFRFDEWLGGAALVAPNPLWSSLSLFRSDRTDAGVETLQLQIVPRRSAEFQADLTSLTAHIAEQRAEAWTSLVSLPVGSNGRASVTLLQPSGAIGYALHCRDRGLLRMEEPHHWINQFGLDSSMGSRQARIEVPAGGRRKPGQSYAVTQYAHDQSLMVGEAVDDRSRYRLITLTSRRKERERRAAASQKLFGILPGTTPPTQAEIDAKMKEAQDYIVELIQRARRRLIFVDPFFGTREMHLFALRNMKAEITPRILTSILALKSIVGAVQGFQVQQGLVFASDVRSLGAKLGTQAPLVRVMPGQDKPVIHDRYLVIDDAVWHCGPSFNEIGERLGVLTRLPNPLEIRVMIGRVWRSSTALLDLAPAPPSAGQS